MSNTFSASGGPGKPRLHVLPAGAPFSAGRRQIERLKIERSASRS